MIRRCCYFLLVLVFVWLAGLLAYAGIVMRLQPYTGAAEGIVVLTGGDGRIETGLQLLKAQHAQRLLISGVNPNVKLSKLLAFYPGSEKLKDKIELGFAAQDTLGNADETAKWVEDNEIQSLIIVTAHYHMPRALVHLGNQLPEVAIYPYPVVPKLFQQADWVFNPNALRLMVQDYNKFLATYPQIVFSKGF